MNRFGQRHALLGGEIGGGVESIDAGDERAHERADDGRGILAAKRARCGVTGEPPEILTADEQPRVTAGARAHREGPVLALCLREPPPCFAVRVTPAEGEDAAKI